MHQSRLTTLSAAFRDAPLCCGALTLRPITSGSVLLLMETGNALFTESSSPTESDMFQGLFEFIYIHTAPRPEVLAACDDRATLRTRARDLAMDISFDDLAAFQAQFEGLRERLNASLVDIVPEKGTPEGKPAPAMPAPIGSPPSSTPLEVVETPSASIGSSGSSPSTAPSNTSMPPMPQTDPARAGRSRIYEAEAPFAETPETPPIPLP